MMEKRMEVFVSSLEGGRRRELFLKARTYNRLVARTCMWNRYDRTYGRTDVKPFHRTYSCLPCACGIGTNCVLKYRCTLYTP